jgi:hypothetical protein
MADSRSGAFDPIAAFPTRTCDRVRIPIRSWSLGIRRIETLGPFEKQALPSISDSQSASRFHFRISGMACRAYLV